jgi:acetylcholinesterase
MAASALTFNAARRDNDWTNFVSGVASCTNTARSNNTFDCLQNANSSDILAGLVAAISEAPEQFAFPPTIDGEGGLYPDIVSQLLPRGLFARLPFIAGTNLDEGKPSLPAYTYLFC